METARERARLLSRRMEKLILVLMAMREAPLSRVAPAREVSMLFAALLGGQLLGEGEKGWRIAGAALIGAGVIALAV